MKAIRYITSIQIQNRDSERLNISLGFERNGAMRMCFGDATELGQDSTYINETSFPNSGTMVHGKYSMWLSMFGRHAGKFFEDDNSG